MTNVLLAWAALPWILLAYVAWRALAAVLDAAASARAHEPPPVLVTIARVLLATALLALVVLVAVGIPTLSAAASAAHSSEVSR